MTITVLTGLPGSGKSTRLIEMVNKAIEINRPVQTFSCSDSPWLQAREYTWVYKVLGCRRPGLVCPLHHFRPATDCAEILDNTPKGTLVAFDEAHYFGTDIVSHWIDASRRGLEVVLAMPSSPQLQLLNGADYEYVELRMKCQRCGVADALISVVLFDKDVTLSVCAACNEKMTETARQELLTRLEQQPPYPGEKAIYQPVPELEECADWRLLRPDSQARVDLMTKVLREVGLPAADPPGASGYLDVGCNSGFFCHNMRRLGFYAEGVDVYEGDIAVARLLDTYFRKDHNNYIAEDAHRYLSRTRERKFDVTSAFAVFQWVMIQTTVERGIECLEMLFEKTGRVCFLEMGYGSEEQYKGRLPEYLDREWVRRLMEEKGGFSEVRMFDAGEFGLMFGSRDLFVGIK